MPISILMPALSPTMTEGNLVKWHKKEGDPIKSGDLLAEIETDKATMEVEAVDEGKLGRILVPEGTEAVKVNACIALILEKNESEKDLDSWAAQFISTVTDTSKTPNSQLPTTPIPLETSRTKIEHKSHVSTSSRIAISPLARRFAQTHGIDITGIAGTGPKGRIIKNDIENAQKHGLSRVSLDYPNHSSPSSYRDVALTTMRNVIAKRLTESKQTIPHFYLTIDCVLDDLLAIRATLNEHFKNKSQSIKLTVNDFIIKAAALSLSDVPEANAQWIGRHIRYFDHADIAVAVAIDGGLITPIVTKADLKSVSHISMEVKELAERAKSGKLKPDEYQGGSFSISNLGMYGIKHFEAIVNPPQACILAIGAGEERPIAREGQVRVGTVLTVSLSADHRIVDGRVGAQLLTAFKRYIEHPSLLLLGA